MLYFSLILLLIISLNLFFSYRKHKWFVNLKPNDKISVKIYSKNCECNRVATVKATVDNDYIEANLSPETLKKCESCSFMRAREHNGSNNCWYNVSLFKEDNTNKIQ